MNGQRHELTREDVEARLVEVAPDAIRKHAVRVNDTWFPAVQAFEVATGIPRSEFISHTARRHLAALGFEVAGDVETTHDAVARRRRCRAGASCAAGGNRRPAPVELGEGEWHTEANVQAALVTRPAGEAGGSSRWPTPPLRSTASTSSPPGTASTVGVEVKGFPSRNYADPARAGQAKRTSPSTQAGHWYSQAVLAAMRLRGKEPAWAA